MASDLSMNSRVALILLMLIGLLIGGCSDSQCQKPAVDNAEHSATSVISYDTMYYRIGPQQAMPPDGQFKAGTRVEIIQEAGSYTLVRAEDGREGYVSTDAIKAPQDGR